MTEKRTDGQELPEWGRHLFEAGFTVAELRAIFEGLQYAVTLGEAGVTGDLGDLGGGKVKWTPEKREALDRSFAEMKRGTPPGA